MKVGFSILAFLLVMGAAKAGDISCQVDLLKPKIKAAVIEEEVVKDSELTFAEARIRSQQVTKKAEPVIENTIAETEQQITKIEMEDSLQTEDSEVTTKSEKKESRRGGLFDILLPSKLRNPVR